MKINLPAAMTHTTHFISCHPKDVKRRTWKINNTTIIKSNYYLNVNLQCTFSVGFIY